MNDFNGFSRTELPSTALQLRLPREYLAVKMGLIDRSIDRSFGELTQTELNHPTSDRQTWKHERIFSASYFVEPIGK